jgi:hypothetical protein
MVTYFEFGRHRIFSLVGVEHVRECKCLELPSAKSFELSWYRVGLFPAENLFADVRPELLEDVIQHS